MAATDSLTASQARGTLIQTLEQAVDAVVVIDARNCVTLFNASAEALWGRPRAEVLGRNVSMLVPRGIRAQHDSYVDANRDTGVNHIVGTSREVVIERSDGSIRWGSMSISKVYAEAGVLYTAFIRDVTHEVKRREERRLLSLAVNETDSAIIVVGVDGRTIYINDGFTRMLGYGLADMYGKVPSTVVRGRYTDEKTLEYIKARLAARESFRVEILVYDRCGKPLWIQAVVNMVIDEYGACTNMVGVWTDITNTKMHEVLQQKVLSAMAREAPILDVMMLICLEVERIAPEIVTSICSIDKQGRLSTLAAPSLPHDYISAVDGLVVGADLHACGITGLDGQPLVFADISASSCLAPFRALARAGGLAAYWSHAIRSSDGRLLGKLTFYYREAREPDLLHRRLVDVSLNLCALALEREASKENIRRLAFYDSLTGLPNRAFLIAHTESLLASAARTDHTLAVLFIDLDRFKHVNDSLGHPAGDTLLCEVAQRLKGCLRAFDFAGRLSGDEFVVVLSPCGEEEARALCERIMAALHEPVTVGSTTLTPTASAGIAIFPRHGHEMNTLLLHADMAMYQAKAAGRHRYAMFSAELNRVAQDRLKFETALRNALASDELQLHYQPQVCLSDGSLHGVEALARWRHPEFGVVPPDRFIPLAEEGGFITELDHWVLRRACRQLAEWRAQWSRDAGADPAAASAAIPHVSVNVSPTSFCDRRLPGLISRTLTAWGLAPGDLVLEVTESVLLDAASGGLATLGEVHRLGVGLSIDDFGTGYSSLSYLHRLPVSELKLDKSFVRELESDEGARALACAVMGIGASLSLDVVAEGVETDAQRTILLAQGCEVAQGYFFARPMPAAELTAWLRSRLAQSVG
ncbi:EAL domain-containing protein [Trinickia terrae]|uniref:EAL domain-containing protein n=1 Tax=Trinickia terrae TaxID=2571161 RepID=UPI001F10A260|nr:EAL domain-containing protein [Trinickia terrae]